MTIIGYESRDLLFFVYNFIYDDFWTIRVNELVSNTSDCISAASHCLPD